MNTRSAKKSAKIHTSEVVQISQFFGEIMSFNNGLKLIHWSVTGKGSYTAHVSLDEAITALWDATDRIIETTYASLENLNIAIPETTNPTDFIEHISRFYDHVESRRLLFAEPLTQSIIDDYQEGIKQLLYRLKRLQ
jgi:DNA-binding ferritin-like protein